MVYIPIGGEAAVHDDLWPGDVPVRVRAQEDNHVSHLLHCTYPSRPDPPPVRFPHLVVPCLRIEGRLYGTGGDGV